MTIVHLPFSFFFASYLLMKGTLRWFIRAWLCDETVCKYSILLLISRISLLSTSDFSIEAAVNWPQKECRDFLVDLSHFPE